MPAPALAIAGTAALVAAPLAGLWATARHDDQASVEVEGDTVAVRGLHAMPLWALRREVRLPISAVTSVEVTARGEAPAGFRSPGAELPGVVRAGTFRRKGEKSIWYVGRAKRVLVIRATGHDPSAVVVQVADLDAVAHDLRTRLSLDAPTG